MNMSQIFETIRTIELPDEAETAERRSLKENTASENPL